MSSHDHLALWRRSCQHHGLGSCRKSHPKYSDVRHTYDQAREHGGMGFFDSLKKIAGPVLKQVAPKLIDIAKDKGAEFLKNKIAGNGMKKACAAGGRRGRPRKMAAEVPMIKKRGKAGKGILGSLTGMDWL